MLEHLVGDELRGLDRIAEGFNVGFLLRLAGLEDLQPLLAAFGIDSLQELQGFLQAGAVGFLVVAEEFERHRLAFHLFEGVKVHVGHGFDLLADGGGVFECLGRWFGHGADSLLGDGMADGADLPAEVAAVVRAWLALVDHLANVGPVELLEVGFQSALDLRQHLQQVVLAALLSLQHVELTERSDQLAADLRRECLGDGFQDGHVADLHVAGGVDSILGELSLQAGVVEALPHGVDHVVHLRERLGLLLRVFDEGLDRGEERIGALAGGGGVENRILGRVEAMGEWNHLAVGVVGYGVGGFSVFWKLNSIFKSASTDGVDFWIAKKCGDDSRLFVLSAIHVH